ncbi:MAG: hypothetical protein IBX67_06145 [Dehalococcoidia bacterium]|nr:hypothetical protein [Dehalococcoidia bacterium]
MHKSFKAELFVNDAAIELNPFVEQFLAGTVAGGVSSLRGVENIERLELGIEGGDVRLIVNGEGVPLTPFPADVIRSTVIGLVSSLKGVGEVESAEIRVKII